MALKDIDKIIRADRYTQDGRDEVCKALEQETEDRTYNIGEISQKTGLQKTANGWVEPPKRGGSNKSVQPADIRENERRKAENERDHVSMSERDFENRRAEEMFRNEAINMSDSQLKRRINDPTTPKGVAKIYEGVLNRRTSHGNPFHLEHEDPQNMTITKEDEERFGKAALSGLSGPRESASEWITSSNGNRMQVSEAQNKIQSNQQKIDSLKKEMEGKSKADNFRAGAELKRLENENEYLRERVPASLSQEDLLAKKREWDMTGGPSNEQERAEYDKLKSQIKYKVPNEKSSFQTDINRMKKLKNQDYREFGAQLEKLHSKYPINKWQDLYNKINTDCAPRQLTGDCKVKVRKG